MKYLPTLETERLIIRPITMDDLHDFYEMDSQPEVHVYLKAEPVKTIEQTRQLLKIYSVNTMSWDMDDWQLW